MCICLLQCANNGIDYDALVTKERKGEKVKTIEMFFFGVPYLFGMHFFPNLTTLRIVNQSLRKIEGLDCCPYLEVVWFAECKIEVRVRFRLLLSNFSLPLLCLVH